MLEESIIARLESLRLRSTEIHQALVKEDATDDMAHFTQLNKEYSEIAPIVDLFKSLQDTETELNGAKELLDSADSELIDLAKIEVSNTQEKIAELEKSLKFMLLPKDEADDGAAYLEIRAGAGGDEAAIFAADLFRMYSRLSERQGWKIEIVNMKQSEPSGLKEAVVKINGQGVFKFLKFESKRNRVAENKRLLYVACTRPVKKLFLFAQIEQSKNMLKNPAQTSLLHCIWHSIAEEIKLDNIIVEKHSELLRDMSPSKNYQDLRRLPPKFKPENNVGFGIDNRIKQLDVNSDTLRVKVAYSDTRSFRARALGTVLHRTLKQISLDGTSEWTKRRIKEHKVVMNSRLREIGFIATVEELKELELAICKVLNDKVGRWILGSHDNTRVEYSINYKLKPNIELHRSTIDLTFVENGYRWIIDYKYYQQNEQETEEDFHERVKSENAPQLLHYGWLFKKMGQVHIKCAIYLLGTCKLLEIPYQ